MFFIASFKNIIKAINYDKTVHIFIKEHQKIISLHYLFLQSNIMKNLTASTSKK